MGSNEKQQGLRQDLSISRLKEFLGDFPLPPGDTCLVIPADLVKTHLGPILCISTGVAVVVASKEKSSLKMWRTLL